MSEVDALFRLLSDAPPRSAEIVKRVALLGVGLPRLAGLYGVDEPRAQVLLFRAFQDVLSGGSVRVPDEREPVEIAVMLDAVPSPPLSQGEGLQARALWQRLQANSEALQDRLKRSAAEFAASPDRGRDELLRYLAIALVIALTAFFYWREQNKPHPPPRARPTVAPSAAP